jgi:hypothetical protein
VFFLLRPNWKKLNKTIWARLGREVGTSRHVHRASSFGWKETCIEVDDAAAALSDPPLARDEFFRLPEPQNEPKGVELLERFYSVF